MSVRSSCADRLTDMHIQSAPIFEGSLSAYDAAGYPVLYHAIDPLARVFASFCADCANLRDVRPHLTSWESFLEGLPEQCYACGRAVHSAHGDPDEVGK